MARYRRSRELVDRNTGELVISDETVVLSNGDSIDRAKFVKVFFGALPILGRFKPSEMVLALYILSSLRSGSVALKISFEGYQAWCTASKIEFRGKSSYYRALRGLEESGFLGLSLDGNFIINHHFAFVGNRSKILFREKWAKVGTSVSEDC